MEKKLKSQFEKFKLLRLVLAGMIAALYVVLTLPMASFAFGIIQFRLAEILTVLPVLSLAAVPGVFLGCLISNVLNPQNLGLIDILCGSGATLIAALLSYWIGNRTRTRLRQERSAVPTELGKFQRLQNWFWRILALLPPVLINAFVVGTYLPFLTLDNPSSLEVAGSIAMIFISQAFVIFILGLPALYALEKVKLPIGKI